MSWLRGDWGPGGKNGKMRQGYTSHPELETLLVGNGAKANSHHRPASPTRRLHWFLGLANTVYVYQCNGGMYHKTWGGGGEGKGGMRYADPAYFARRTAIFAAPSRVARRLFRIQSSVRLSPACGGLESRVREANGSGFLCASSHRACVKLFVRHTATVDATICALLRRGR